MSNDTQTQTLSGFLLQRITEDEAAAREATPGPWVQGGTHWRDEVTGESRVMHAHVAAKGPETIMVADMNTHPIIGRPTIPPRNEGNSAHIARHDPARVLAECAAMRRIVEQVSETAWAGYAVRDVILGHLAAPYADHPEFRPEWAL